MLYNVTTACVDNVGSVLFNSRIGTTEFLPRLYEAKYTEEEKADLAKYDTEDGEILESCHWVREVTIEPEEVTK